MPFSKFVIQYQSCTATTAGIDHDENEADRQRDPHPGR